MKQLFLDQTVLFNLCTAWVQDVWPAADDYDDSESDAALEVESAAKTAVDMVPSVEGDVINIFSIASGHMYERLQKIMMLSVLRNTKQRVKFWLIKNYMSPQMREFLPYMAARFGFEVWGQQRVKLHSITMCSGCYDHYMYVLYHQVNNSCTVDFPGTPAEL